MINPISVPRYVLQHLLDDSIETYNMLYLRISDKNAEILINQLKIIDIVKELLNTS